MFGIYEKVDTWRRKVGKRHRNLLDGNGGLSLGCTLLHSIDSSNAVSSPQTKAHAPSLIDKSNSKSVPKTFFPSIPLSFA